MDDIVLFEELSVDDANVIGKKAAYMAELYSKGFPLPNGFVVTGNLFVKFIELSKLKERIAEILISTEDNDKKSLQIQQIIMNTHFPDDMADFIYKNYIDIFKDNKNTDIKSEPYVALRVSSTSDYVDDSFLLNIKGKERLINGIKSAWASLFTPKNLPLKRFKPSIIVQRMINAAKSGVIYSYNPINNNSNEVLIQVCSGLGNSITLSQVKPSTYITDKTNLSLKQNKFYEQNVQYTLSIQKERTERIEMNEIVKNILDDFIIRDLTKMATKVEGRLGQPQRINFAIDKQVHIIGSRPFSSDLFKKKHYDIYSDLVNNQEDDLEQNNNINSNEDETMGEISMENNRGEEDNNNFDNVQSDLNEMNPEDKQNLNQQQDEVSDDLLEHYEPEIHATNNTSEKDSTVKVDLQNNQESYSDDTNPSENTTPQQNNIDNSTNGGSGQAPGMGIYKILNGQTIEEPSRPLSNETVSGSQNNINNNTNNDSVMDENQDNPNNQYDGNQNTVDKQKSNEENVVYKKETIYDARDISSNNEKPVSNTQQNPPNQQLNQNMTLNLNENHSNFQERNKENFSNNENPTEVENNKETKETKDEFVSKYMPNRPDQIFSKILFSGSMMAVSCDLAITNALREKYKAVFFSQAPDSFEQTINNLKTKVNVPYEQQILIIRRLRNDFLDKVREMSAIEIQNCIEFTKKFLDEF